LEESAERQNAFSLLRAILTRKIVLPEVYDLMTRVQELVVRSQAAQVRQLASTSFLQFLLDYPLGADRLKKHLQFLLTNLSYEHESGRLAALDMLGAVIEKFPGELLTDWAETLFLPLVTRLVNDQSSKCRSTVAACISSLLKRISMPRRDRLVVYCMQWLSGTDARLVRAAAQTLGILVDIEGPAVARRLPEILPLVADVLKSRVDMDAAATASEIEDDACGAGEEMAAALSQQVAPGWQEAYYGVGVLEKALAVAPDQLAWGSGGDAGRDCWVATQRLLLHRHVWVRKAAGRAVGMALADASIGPLMLAAAGDVAAGALALSFFNQLDSPAADDAMAGQAVKCLVYLSSAMYEADALAGRLPTIPARGGEGGGVGGTVSGNGTAVGSGGSGTARGNASSHLGKPSKPCKDGTHTKDIVHGVGDPVDGGDDGQDTIDEEESAERSHAAEAASGWLSLRGLMHRMARVADDKSFVRQVQRNAALRFIAAVASRLGPDRVSPYLPTLLRPLYRITEPLAMGNSDDIKSLSDEIVAHMRSLIGADAFLAAYNAARESVKRQRGDRKQRAAVQALVDPEAAAKRKLRASARKAVGKRKALEEVRRKRSAGVVVKNRGQLYKRERR